MEVLALDVTDPAQVARAAEQAPDVSVLINNAGVSTYQSLTTGEMDKIRLEMDTHFYGSLNMVRAFAPVLGANGGGAILSVLSVLSWLTFEGATVYGAAKAAEWSLTDGIRLELAPQGTLVTGLHVGAVDTDMMAGWDIPKNDPADVVRAGLDGLAADRQEVLADDAAVQAKGEPRHRSTLPLRAGRGADELNRIGASRSSATIPFGSPVWRSRWKYSKNTVPPGSAAACAREELAAVSRLLRCPAIAEVEQYGVEQVRADAAGLPARVKVAWRLLVGDQASVEIHVACSRRRSAAAATPEAVARLMRSAPSHARVRGPG